MRIGIGSQLLISIRRFGLVWAFVIFLFPGQRALSQTLAEKPPMGWNSWDAYGLGINQDQFFANLRVLASLKRYGWNYAVVDEGWYLENPFDHPQEFRYSHDGNGRLVPALERFPLTANGAGFKPMADKVHALGLKFGIHIIRGIPKEAVRDNLPVADSEFHAGEAADTGDACPWNPDNFGVRDNPAGQAYYDSILHLYASWGVDFLKVDCIADHPYKADEIRMIANAIRKSGRPIVLSLSPGPTSLNHAEEVARYAQMWRIADDIWDGWDFSGWPKGLLSAFDNLARWSKYAGPGHWPDADMLPWSSLRPHPGWGSPRQSRLSPDEQRTQFTLWAIARTPMILGANLTDLDPLTLSLIRNREVIALNQNASSSSEIPSPDASRLRIWSASTGGHSPRRYIAVFNLENTSVSKDIPWSELLNQDKIRVAAWDVWQHRHMPPATDLHIELPAHGCALFRIKP